MSEEEQKAILNLEHIVEYWEPDDENDEFANIEYNSIKVAVNLIYKLLKEIDKKDKTIDAMSELLCSLYLVDELGQDSWNWNKEQMKEYFYKKVEKENGQRRTRSNKRIKKDN